MVADGIARPLEAAMLGQIIPNLWFDGTAEEAAAFYADIFGGRVLAVTRAAAGSPIPEGQAVSVEWEMNGQHFVGINGGPGRPLTEAFSLAVQCEDSAEVDRLWTALLAGGGEESMCGWLRDRYGLSWQVVPIGLVELLSDPDPDRARRVTEAMLGMRKLDIDALRAAADAG
jgi:predicted 3-demethylubiquinone-9 3-methyltransferase (glyoxalase superfamily)